MPLTGARGKVPHPMAEETRGQRFVPTMGHLGRSADSHPCVGTHRPVATSPPTVFAMEARGRRHCGIIYLLAKARSGEGGPCQDPLCGPPLAATGRLHKQ